jgi:hypothetical protein
MQPSIRDDRNVVIGGHRLKHRHREGNIVLFLSIPLAKHEGVIKEDDLSIDVFNNYYKCFGCAMNFLIPAKIGDDGKVDTKEGSSNGLDLRLQSDKPDKSYR